MSRKRHDLGPGRAGQGDLGHVAGLELVERRISGMSLTSGAGIGKAVGAGRGLLQDDEEPVFDLLGQVVLEARGQAVGLVPCVPEHVGEEALDDAVAADDRHGHLPPDGGELHAPVGDVVDQPAVGQPLDGGGHRARGDAQGLGQIARCGPRRPDPAGRSAGRPP